MVTPQTCSPFYRLVILSFSFTISLGGDSSPPSRNQPFALNDGFPLGVKYFSVPEGRHFGSTSNVQKARSPVRTTVCAQLIHVFTLATEVIPTHLVEEIFFMFRGSLKPL